MASRYAEYKTETVLSIHGGVSREDKKESPLSRPFIVHVDATQSASQR